MVRCRELGQLLEVLDEANIVILEVEVEVSRSASSLADAQGLEFAEIEAGSDAYSKVYLASLLRPGRRVDVEFSGAGVDQALGLEALEEREHLSLEPALKSAVSLRESGEVGLLVKEPLSDTGEDLFHILGSCPLGTTLTLPNS